MLAQCLMVGMVGIISQSRLLRFAYQDSDVDFKAWEDTASLHTKLHLLTERGANVLTSAVVNAWRRECA